MEFSGFVIAAAGNLKPYTHNNLEVLINRHGGEYSESCDGSSRVTHLVCSQAAYQAKTQKVQFAIWQKSVRIVHVDWLHDCVGSKKTLPETNYLFEKESNPVVKSKKQPGSDSDTDSGETTSDEARVQSKHIYAGITGALKDNKIIKLGSEWISESLLTPVPVPIPAAANTKKDVPHVYMSPGKRLYCITLSRCNIGERKTINRLIDLQIVKSDIGPHAPQYAFCFKTTVGNKTYGGSDPGSENTLGFLIDVYESEIKKQIAQGYVPIFYDNNDNSMEHEYEAAPSEQTLKARNVLYNLLELILPAPEVIPMKLEAKSAEYDRLVFKTLSKKNISKGENILAELKEAVMKLSSKQNSTAKSKRVIYELTSRYYSHVPHEPVILLDNLRIIQDETNMLKSLEGVRMSAVSAREINLGDDGHDETLDRHFKALGLKNIDVVDRDLQEFALIERYFVNTGGRTDIPASWTLQIFRIERSDDEERWNSAGWNKMTKGHDGRYLLWHGMPLDRVGTILRDGLKDSSKRGGVFFSDTAETSLGYSQQFGEFKGEVVAMLLCEVQLGNIPNVGTKPGGKSVGAIGSQLGKMNYKWTDAGQINQNLEGIQMPDVEDIDSCPYERVEYVARESPSQIKHRYLVLCGPKMEG